MPSTSPELKTILTRAGAGAGKTTRLVAEVVNAYRKLRELGVKNPRLVVTTFTRKATQELKERLLKEAFRLEDGDFLNLVLSKRDLHISTIHGTLNLFLKRHGDRMGLDPAFRMTDGAESRRWTMSYLRERASDKKVSSLLEALGYSELSHRLLQLSKVQIANSKMRPFDLKELVGSRESYWQEFRTRLAEFLSLMPTEHKSWAKFHEDLTFINSLLRDFPKRDNELREACQSLRKPQTKPGPKSASEEMHEQAGELVEFIKASEEPMYWTGRAEEYASISNSLRLLVSEFQPWLMSEKLKRGVLEFDDLELLSMELLRRHPECGIQFGETWNYWLIDEYQDTSPLQVTLLDHLMKGAPHFVVGDPQQSIYYFRGARSEVFDQKEAEIRASGGQFEELNRNYRSAPSLMEFINSITTPLGFQAMKVKEDEPFQMETPVAVIGLTDKPDSELSFIGHQISELLKSKVTAEKICILARKNETLRQIGFFLESLNIPTQIHAAGGFFEKREILDLLSILKFLINPFDDLNLLCLLRSPWFRVQDSTLAEWRSEKGALWKRCQSSDHPRVMALKTGLELTSEMGLIGAFEGLVLESGLVEWSHDHDVTGQREANIWKFILDLNRESRQPGFQPLSFITRTERKFELESDASEGEAAPAFEPNRVNLMTVHMAKGLQFDYLFVPKCHEAFSSRDSKDIQIDTDSAIWSIPLLLQGEEKKSWPLQTAEVKARELEESRREFDRVFYVAVTRAKKKVYLSTGGEIKPESWAGRWGIELKEGSIVRENFRFEINIGPWNPLPIESPKSEVQKSVGPLFQLKDKGQKDRMTVTEILSTSAQGRGISDTLGALKKARRGVAIHKVFEAMHYQGVEKTLKKIPDLLGEFSESSKRMNGEPQRASPNKDSEKLREFILAPHEIPLLKLIEGGRAEYGFLIQVDEQVLEGQIDLWGEVEGQKYIVDYKSGDSRNSDKAFEQLRLYAFALSKMGHGQTFILAAVFPFEGKVLTEKFEDAESYFLKKN